MKNIPSSLRATDDEFPSLFKPLTDYPNDSSTVPATFSTAFSSSPVGKTYCRPTDSCWPSLTVWQTLNTTVNGNLVLPLPETYPCSVDPNGNDCQTVIQNFSNPFWRVKQIGATQSPIWEVNFTTGEGCYVFGQPCNQGYIPPIAVNASKASYVSAALSFAHKYNIQVVIKSSGHEYQGRSSGAGTLLIWTQYMKGFKLGKNYVPCTGDTPVPNVVTTQPGTSYGDIYNALPDTLALVGGSARTVSSAGGHVLAGGHSFMSPHFGLAADNVLQFSAVLANGTSVTASHCENPDLFWALRGSGGSSFAVVTSATYRLHNTPPTGVTGLVLEVALIDGLQSVGEMYGVFLTFTPSFLKSVDGSGVWGGYFNVEPVSSTEYVFIGVFVYNDTVANAQASMSEFITYLGSQSQYFYIVNTTFTPYPTFNDWHNTIDSVSTGDRTGSPLSLTSRFVPLAYASNATQVTEVATLLANLAQYLPILGHLVVGGAVSQYDPNSEYTSVTPAFRTAGWHIAMGAGWDLNATYSEYWPIFQALNQFGDAMRSTLPYPDSGAYFNEADYLDPEWINSYWGRANFARLQRIKTVYDPQGVFSCYNCVPLPPSITLPV